MLNGTLPRPDLGNVDTSGMDPRYQQYVENIRSQDWNSLNPRQQRIATNQLNNILTEVPDRSQFTEEQLQRMGGSRGDSRAYTTHPQAQKSWEHFVRSGGLNRFEGVRAGEGDIPFTPTTPQGGSGSFWEGQLPANGNLAGGAFWGAGGNLGRGNTLPPVSGQMRWSGSSGGLTGGGSFGAYNGDNQAFYGNQFSQLLGNAGANREASYAAEIRRQQEQANAAERQPFEADWSWANLPEVTTSFDGGSSGGEVPAWVFNPSYSVIPGETTNLQLANMVAPNLSNRHSGLLFRHLRETGHGGNTDWSQLTNPEAFYSSLGPEVSRPWRDTMRNFGTELFVRGGTAGAGPGDAPPGYAAPR